MSTSPSLPALLSSLALGARSVSSLPLHGDEDASDDEYAFRMSLPEFSTLNYEAQSLLKSLLKEALLDDTASDVGEDEGLEDPLLWEKCANACEALIDSVSEYLSGEKEEKVVTAIGNAAEIARERAEGKYSQMLRGVVDMEKPQNVYQGFVTFPPQNSRDEPFVPIIAFDAQKQMMLDNGRFNKSGHGLDTRYQNRNVSPSDDHEMEGPSYHIEHPFREEIEELEYKPWQLDVSNVESCEVVKSKDFKDKGVWIGTEDDLEQLVKRISKENITEIAIDLEAHSHRTFAGFVCLIQLSIRDGGDDKMDPDDRIAMARDFLIDALSLRHAISISLGPILANPNIVKVMHGADSDVPWLQRDFGCYVVNLFDTGRASRALKFPSAGLAYLLRKYAKVEADKSHQLADWRKRPLPDDMREYAVSDTRYLLDIYDQLRWELENHSSPDVSIKSVLDRSKDVCLIRYNKEPFRPLGYKFIMDGGKRDRKKGLAQYLKGKHEVTSDLSVEQEKALKALFDWRDQTARREDESVQYVCPNAALLRIASNRPSTVSALQRLVNPPPPLVLRRSQEILEILNGIKTSVNDSSKSSLAAAASKSSRAAATSQSLQTEKSTSSDPVPPPTPSRNREMLSPILGSDMLYEKAGWNTASESEDESKRRFLEVSKTNEGFQTSSYASHSLQMAPRNSSDRSFEEKEDLIKGEKSAKLIRDEFSQVDQSKIINGFDVMKYIRPYAFKETRDNILRDEDEPSTSNTYEDMKDADEMIIPKSMSEVYTLSNANRRRGTYKEKSPKTSQEKTNDFDAKKFPEDDIEGAKKVLASRLGGYFGENKRQKPNCIPPGKEGDVELMIKMGWVKNREEIEDFAATSNVGSDQGDIEQKRSSDKGSKSDYYATIGAGIPAFDPNSAPSNNPFFQGAAAGAASLFTGEKPKNYKSGKRNKKR